MKRKPAKKPKVRGKAIIAVVDEPAALLADEQLLPRHRRFVELYLGGDPVHPEADGNGVVAARLAGYQGDPVTLAVQAYRLRNKPKVREAIEARMEGDGLVMNRQRRLRLISAIADGKALEEGGDKPDIDARLRALKLLCDLSGDAPSQKLEVTHTHQLAGMSTAALLVELGQVVDVDDEEGD